MKGLINRLFFPWSKWEVEKKDLVYTRTRYNPLTGWEEPPTDVLVDINLDNQY